MYSGISNRKYFLQTFEFFFFRFSDFLALILNKGLLIMGG